MTIVLLDKLKPIVLLEVLFQESITINMELDHETKASESMLIFN